MGLAYVARRFAPFSKISECSVFSVPILWIVLQIFFEVFLFDLLVHLQVVKTIHFSIPNGQSFASPLC